MVFLEDNAFKASNICNFSIPDIKIRKLLVILLKKLHPLFRRIDYKIEFYFPICICLSYCMTNIFLN